MGFMGFIAKLFAPEKVKAFMPTDGGGASSGAGYAGESVTSSSVLALSAAWACGNLISGTISSMPFGVHRLDSAGFMTVDASHPLHGVISESPNYDQTALDFWDAINLAIEFHGNAYAKVDRSGERVTALHLIHPDSASVKRLASGALEYRWTLNGKQFTGTDRDILHIRGPGGDPLGGMSTLQFGRQAFSSALAADRAAAQMFANGMRSSALLKFQQWLTPEQRKVTEQILVEKYMGAMNAGRPFIAEGGVDFQQLSITPEDAQMLQTRQHSVEEVCRYFGVPPVMVGHSGGSTAWPTSVEQQGLIFQKFTLRRRIKRIEQAVNKQLLTPADRAAGVSTRINMDSLLRGDSTSRAAYYQTMTQIGGMTINEVRRLENLPPVPGGDTPRMQMQNVPIDGPQGGENGA